VDGKRVPLEGASKGKDNVARTPVGQVEPFVTEGPSYSTVTGSTGRRPWTLLLLASALVALAIVKPWAGAADQSIVPSPSAARVTGLRPAAPMPTMAPTPAELARPYCPGTLLWMMHSFQRRGDDLYDVWTVTEPVAAAAANPATIAYTPIYATRLMAFGYCAPEIAELRPRPSDMPRIWRVGEDGEALRLMTVSSMEPDLRPDFGALLAPQPSTAPPVGAETGWPAGRYLIKVGDAVLGAEVVLVRFSR